MINFKSNSLYFRNLPFFIFISMVRRIFLQVQELVKNILKLKRLAIQGITENENI